MKCLGTNYNTSQLYTHYCGTLIFDRERLTEIFPDIVKIKIRKYKFTEFIKNKTSIIVTFETCTSLEKYKM